MKRFQIDLLIVHPSLDPTEISVSLGIDAQFRHEAGDPRWTPTGTPLSGGYRDTRWRYVERFETDEQYFAQQLEGFVESLGRHKTYFGQLKTTGGSAQVILQFPGDGYFGDTIPVATLSKLSELGLDLGLEIFTDRQA